MGRAESGAPLVESFDRMSWIATAALTLALVAGLVGYLVPRMSRILGWVALVGAIPIGMAAFRSGAASGRSCGEMMAGVCQLFALGMGAVAGVAVGLAGVCLLLGAAMAKSRARGKRPVIVGANIESDVRE
jgi:hypothetical protein